MPYLVGKSKDRFSRDDAANATLYHDILYLEYLVREHDVYHTKLHS